ncbi:unnamed protein product [Somion occarium]|uniref:HIT domain-containing protein n=1 Tax=Somion occarium TaxID=3059160 RepID=A0ABP1E7Y4_9APHY
MSKVSISTCGLRICGSSAATEEGDTAWTRRCTFCNVSKSNGFDVVWEDDHFVAFRDHNPAAEHHFLVIPKEHVGTVKTLTKSDVDMVQRLVKIGHTLLSDHNVPENQRRLGFHIPPFSSVPHLHLHAQGLPYRSLFRKMKYAVATGRKARDKGFSWFVEAEQEIRILGKGQTAYSFGS